LPKFVFGDEVKLLCLPLRSLEDVVEIQRLIKYNRDVAKETLELQVYDSLLARAHGYRLFLLQKVDPVCQLAFFE
jgi:hypothetical protein